MHIPTHALSGWCAANCLPLTPRERFLCILAATLADLDGVALLHSIRAYQTWHHVLGHNVFYGLALSGILLAAGRRLWWLFLAYLGLFHLHLLMDIYGSGPGWGIAYWWPFSGRLYGEFLGWHFISVQNYLVMAILFAWTFWIYRHRRRGPFEYCWPRADGIFVRLFAPKREQGPKETVS